MTSTQITSNPFAQMMDPHAVIAAVERSERLQALHSRICRPLDRLLPTAEGTEEGESTEAVAEATTAAEPDAPSAA